jgi:hypothetical protein
MAETVKWNKVKYKIWFKQTYERAKDKGRALVSWIAEHPMEAVALGGVAAGVVRKTSNAYCTYKEDVRRNTDYWDPRTGTHAHIRRKLKPAEQETVDERFRKGESYVQIFRDMNILK